MSILDIDNTINDETLLIQDWLKTNCSIRGIEFDIHDNIVDIKAKEPNDISRYINRYIHIYMYEEYFPVDLFRFGECETLSTGDLFNYGTPRIDICLCNCPNLKSLSGLPNNIKTLSIYECPKLETLGDISVNINNIILHDHQFEYKQELMDNIQQYKNHKLLLV